VLRILSAYRSDTYVFGSRASGKSRELSDLDLVIKAAVSREDLAELRYAFEESNLPFKVDLLVWKELDPVFRSQIAPNLIPLAESSR